MSKLAKTLTHEHFGLNSAVLLSGQESLPHFSLYT